MAVFDLSKITEALIWILETRMPALDGWAPGVTATVSPLPPDRLRDAATDLGLYLYHLTEDPAYKNPPPSGSGNAGNPVALNLYYQLTAQVGDQAADAFRAQLLMGAAVRVFHEFALINDSTMLVDATGTAIPILQQRLLAGRENRIRITLRPVPVDDAVDYWTAGEAPLRLAAYYQVSVVLLESEPPRVVPARVLTYGSGVFATSAPMLSGSRALLSLVVGRDPAPSRVPVQPAQVTLGETFELLGSSLTGTGTTLSLRDDRSEPVTVDGSAWAVVASGERVLATPSAALGSQDLLPGIYSAAVMVTRTQRIGASQRSLVHTSNETPIVIAPRLDASSAAGPTLGSLAPGASITWTGWRFAHASIPTDTRDPRALRLYVGDRLLTTVVGAPQPGELRIVDASTLDVHLPADLTRGLALVRVAVRGAYSAPRWLEVT
jgi:hypothetical protein